MDFRYALIELIVVSGGGIDLEEIDSYRTFWLLDCKEYKTC